MMFQCDTAAHFSYPDVPESRDASRLQTLLKFKTSPSSSDPCVSSHPDLSIRYLHPFCVFRSSEAFDFAPTMLDKLFKRSGNKPHTPNITGTDATPESGQKKPSLYRRFQDSKRGELKEEDILRYTGRTKADIVDWGKTAPGVAGNQAAGKLAMGGTSGLGGMAAAEGYGGWGWDANSKPKFPPAGKAAEEKPVEVTK